MISLKIIIIHLELEHACFIKILPGINKMLTLGWTLEVISVYSVMQQPDPCLVKDLLAQGLGVLPGDSL